MGAMVHRCFRSSHNCWHLSFHATATLFLPVFTGCQFMQGSGYLHKVRDDPLIVSCKPKKLWTLVIVVGTIF